MNTLRIPSKEAKTEKYTASLKVELTPKEVAERADKAAQLVADIRTKEEDQKAAAKHAKSIIESMVTDLGRLSGEVRTRSTYKEVECERVWNYTAGTVTEVRLDTGEEVSQRRMTDGERQRELPFEGE